MNVPTPLNDTARDDRFDRGLERLLDGDPRGIDEIEPDLRDVAIHMVSLANDAGWVGRSPGEPAISPVRRSRAATIVNALAAALVIGLIGGMAIIGIQVWGPPEAQFGSGGDEGFQIVEPGPGVCRRAPRTEAEIAAIVRKSEQDVEPFMSQGVQAEVTGHTMQITRDWNACLQAGMWDRAMAYESEHLLWAMGQEEFPDGTRGMTDADIAARIEARHAEIVPINTPDGLNLAVYSAENFRYRHEGGITLQLGADFWLVPVDEQGDWVEWPTVVTSSWDGSQWVIVSTTQAGMPHSEYFRIDALPATPVTTPDG